MISSCFYCCTSQFLANPDLPPVHACSSHIRHRYNTILSETLRNDGLPRPRDSSSPLLEAYHGESPSSARQLSLLAPSHFWSWRNWPFILGYMKMTNRHRQIRRGVRCTCRMTMELVYGPRFSLFYEERKDLCTLPCKFWRQCRVRRSFKQQMSE